MCQKMTEHGKFNTELNRAFCLLFLCYFRRTERKYRIPHRRSLINIFPVECTSFAKPNIHRMCVSLNKCFSDIYVETKYICVIET